MAALEPVVATLLANTEEFTASMDAAKAKVDELAGSAAISGESTGAALAGGIQTGAKDGERKLEEDLEKTGRDGGSKLATGASGGLSKLGNLLSNTGIPGLGALGEAFSKSGEKASELGSKSQGLIGTLTKVGGVAALGLGVGLAGAAAEGLHLANTMQQATTTIATSAGTSTAAAKKIGDAFLNTAGQSEFSGIEMAQAFGKVAGQLKATQGSALTASQALDVMNAAGDLATAKQIDLGTATTAVASTMQAFQLHAKDAATITDVLFNASNATGTSISTLGSQLAKVRTKLGDMSPPLNDLGGLLVDMTEHGETGRAAMSALSTSFTTFLKPAASVAKAQADLKVTLESLPPSMHNLAQAYMEGSVSSTQVTAATKGLTVAQSALWTKFKSAADTIRTANQQQQLLGITTTNNQGKFVGMSSVIAQLHTQIKGMTDAQATAKLSADGFGSSAAKLLTIVKAGPGAYDKATESVAKAGAAHAAAAKQAQTLHVEFQTVKAAAEDLLTQFGQALMPVLTKLIKIFVEVATAILKNKPALIAIAVVIGGVLTAAFVAWTASLFAAGGALEFVLGPIGIIIAAIALLAVGVYEIIKHWKAISGFFAKLWHDVEHVFVAAWDAIKHGVMEAFHAVVGFFKQWGPAILAALVPIVGVPLLLAQHWHRVEADAKAIWGDIVGFFKSIPGKLLGALAAFGGMLLGWIKGVWNTFKGWVTDAWNNEVAFWSTLPGRILGALSAFGGMLLGWITTAFNTVKNWILVAWNNEVAFWSALPGRIIGAIAGFGSMLLGWIRTAWDDFANADHQALTDVLNFFKSIPGKILNALGDATKWLFNVGKDIIRGLVNGIKHAAGDVLNAMKGVAGSIVKAITNPLSIFSPSRVMHGIGMNIMQGLANGIGSGAGLATGAMNDVAIALGGGVGGFGGIRGGVGGLSISPSGGAAAISQPQPINVTLTLDGQTLARLVTQYQARSGRYTGNVLGQYAGGTQNQSATSINPNAVAR